MKKIKHAKSISDIITIAMAQCEAETCRVGIAFANKDDVVKLSKSGLIQGLLYGGIVRGRIHGVFGNRSTIDIFDMQTSAMMCGKRYDYVLMDSQICEEGKIILKACTVKYFGFSLGKDGPKEIRLKDRRKNVVQEFTLAEEWPLLK